MPNSLDKIQRLDKNLLQGDRYFESLLEQAYEKGLLDDTAMERIQYESLSLLAYQTERYNAGDSSSIRIEQAQELMRSILFTLGMGLKSYQNAEDAVSALQRDAIETHFQKGRKRIGSMLAAAKALHHRLCQKLIDTENVFYRSTLADAIQGFFKLYDPEYAAHLIHITADYPLFGSVPKLLGIEFIGAYLDRAYLENQFCSCFSAEDIHHMLCGVEDGYQELLINLYEHALCCALGCVIAGTDPRLLDIGNNGIRRLYHTFAGQSKEEIRLCINQAADTLSRKIPLSDRLKLYIKNSLPRIAQTVEAALQTHTLERVFPAPAFPEQMPKVLVSFGEKMEDTKYRRLIEEIEQCRFTQDKLALVKEQVRALADLEDVLQDIDWTEEETREILKRLTLPEAAALMKRRPPPDAENISEREQRLSTYLRHFMARLQSGSLHPPTGHDTI